MSRENVKTDGEFLIRWVHVNHIIEAVLRNNAENPINEGAMRVEESYPLPAFDVLANQVEEQCAFSSAGRAKDVHVANARFRGEADFDCFASMGVVPQENSICLPGNLRSGLCFLPIAEEYRRPNC